MRGDFPATNWRARHSYSRGITLRGAHCVHVIASRMQQFLQRCLKDLRERFARVDIQASKPIVPFRETTVKAPGKS